MRREPDPSTTAVAAVRPPVARHLILALSLIALAAALAAYVMARTTAPRHASKEAAPSVVASADRPGAPWFLIEPSPVAVGKATNHPAKTKAASPEPDWSALSLGVTDAQAAYLAPKAGNDASPAELRVSMSREERGRLIAAAREADSGTAPAGYRPAIGQLYPAGGGDGICR